MLSTVLVTGANRGIGLEFCRQYLAKKYKVYACCRAPESAPALLSLKQHNPEQLHIEPLDVTNETMRGSFSRILGEQPIDILIHNAGVYGPRDASIGNVSEKDWINTFQVNTIAPLLLTQLLIKNVLRSEEKKIILVSSKMGSIYDNSSGGNYIYRSSKSALNAIGKSLAHDLLDHKISVAVVHPGWVQTDMGGSDATLTSEESVHGLANVIEQLNIKNSGQFLNYDGLVIPW